MAALDATDADAADGLLADEDLTSLFRCSCWRWMSLPDRFERVVALLNPFLTRVRIV
jgi:hypothetical protein